VVDYPPLWIGFCDTCEILLANRFSLHHYAIIELAANGVAPAHSGT
jgi:hypothetical protein